MGGFPLKLWIANALATVLVAVSAVGQLVAASSHSSCGPPCNPRGQDPHGYVVIFMAIPVLVVVLIALFALGSLVGRRRGGFWLALVAAAGCALELLMLWSLMAAVVAVLVGLVVVASVALAIVGLRNAPVHRPYRVPGPPYPSA